jgi:hypothetical protein
VWNIDYISPFEPIENKSPREVWIAEVSQVGLRAQTPELIVERVLVILKEALTYINIQGITSEGKMI